MRLTEVSRGRFRRANRAYPGAVPRYRLLTTRPAAQAPVVVGALLAEGLDARLQPDSLGVVYGLTTGPFATRIFVAEDDFAAARALIRQIEEQS
ncbi:MAG: hypothetical protein GEU74_06315 [Nitriliruptorales bacterium]|nr:hypothetical protein [Nitriliruptorales bacterium]